MIFSVVMKAECVVVDVEPDRSWVPRWCSSDRELWQVCGGRLMSMVFLLVVVV